MDKTRDLVGGCVGGDGRMHINVHAQRETPLKRTHPARLQWASAFSPDDNIIPLGGLRGGNGSRSYAPSPRVYPEPVEGVTSP